jgi:hypothetical protein
MGRWFQKEKTMNVRKMKKFIHEGKYAAEVEVELVETENGWAPYIKLEDALKLDELRIALKHGDLEKAKEMAKIYLLKPIAA